MHSTEDFNIFSQDTITLISNIKAKAIKNNLVIGFTCSCFDLMHAGHCLMLEDASKQCDILIIGLQTDPTIDRPQKNKPIQTYEEREIIVNSKRWVDYVIKYQTEDDLYNILKELKPDVRIIGSDYLDKDFTGKDLDIHIYYHYRNHDYSTTSLRKRIWQAENTDNNKSLKDIKFLDCTIRDGGYINKWNFTDECVKDCYKAVSEAGMDFIELGFRNVFEIYNNSLCGKWRYCPEELLKDMKDSYSGCKIAVMVDFKNSNIDNFLPVSESVVDLIRVAFHKDDMPKALYFCSQLKDLGYLVSANAMATVYYSEKDIQDICELIAKYSIDYLYIADSYGSLNPKTLKIIHDRILNSFNLLNYTEYKLGFHAHNNMQNGLATVLYAIDNGFDIIDSTIFGMGRGAGNICTEVLLSNLINNYDGVYGLLKILIFAEKHIVPLFGEDNNWGYDLAYLISAHFSAHPNYISKLKDYAITNIVTIWEIIENLTNNGQQRKFNIDNLNIILKNKSFLKR